MQILNWLLEAITSKTAKGVGIISLIISLAGALSWADERWDETPELAEYAKNEDIRAVQKSMDKNMIQMQINTYQDDIDEIMDKEIDGEATNADKKKKHRYNTKILNLKEELSNIQ
jgi:hypothetical protein